MKTFKFFIIGLFFVLFSLGQLQRIQINTNIAFYLHDVVILFWLIFSFLYHRTWKNVQIPKNALKNYGLEILFCTTIIIGWIFGVKNFHTFLQPMLYLGRIVAYVLFTASFLPLEITWHKQNILFIGYIASGILVLFWGILQYIFLPDTRFLSVLGWDDHYYRLISTQFDPAFTGMMFVFTFAYLFRLKTIFEKNKYFFYLLLFLLTNGVLFTYSRASYLSFIGVLLGGFYFEKKLNFFKNSLLYFLILFILALPFLPKPGGEGVRLNRTSTIESRKEIAIRDISKLHGYQWIIGHGLFISSEQSQDQNRPNHAHLSDNVLLTIFTGTGIIGCYIFFLLAFKWGKYLYENDSNFFVITLSVLIHSFFNNTLFQPFMLLLWLGGFLNMKNNGFKKPSS